MFQRPAPGWATGRRHRRGPAALAPFAGALLSLLVLPGASAGRASESWAAARTNMLQEYYPFQTACISAHFPGTNNTAMKGIAIRLGHGAHVLFDTDLLRMAAGWTGGFITTRGVAFDGSHGAHPAIAGEQQWGTRPLPGWVSGDQPFADPRPEPFGALPPAWCRWDGLYLHGDRVVLSYTVAGTKIFEEPSSATNARPPAFVRTFRIESPKLPLAMMVCEVEGATGRLDGATALLETTNAVTAAALVGAPAGAQLAIAAGPRIVLKLAPGAPAATFQLVVWAGPKAEAPKFAGFLGGEPKLCDFAQGGPPHWPQGVVTNGTRGFSATPDGAYEVDQLTPPWDNPWRRRVRLGAFDFFADGTRAAVCTWDGDIWVVSGIDDALGTLTWRRFASGLYETLGLKIVNDVIYTSGRDQVTRFHDLNGDGEADFYENFNNQITSTEGFHEYVFDLQTDPAGNFYFSKAGPWRPGGRGFQYVSAHAGCLLKLPPDGRQLEIVATGLRTPNGIGVGPKGELTTGDNEGTWVPATPINWIKPGGWYGVLDTAHREPIPEFRPPLCWLSHTGPDAFDNSAGGQVWVTSDKWGPFAGELLHLSYGKCRLFLVFKEEIAGVLQGGAVRWPLKFTSSTMRGRFNPRDGQLYLCGLGGWQTDTVREGGLDRVRYTGKPVYSLRALNVTKTGVRLTFTQPLDPAAATDVQNYSVKRWNYRRTQEYGSPEFSVANPDQKGRDPVDVKSAHLSPDGLAVTLELADLKPVMQQAITFNLKARDGTPLRQDLQHSIHVVP
jgi:glucose/arabinose dehydrogenase